MNSQTVLTQGVGMTDNSSYGRLQLWAVTVPYKSLQLRSKISVERRERPSHHEPCGRRARDLCGRLAEISLARDGTASSFHPRSCVLGYFAIARHLVHPCFCMWKEYLFLLCLWDRVILGSFFPRGSKEAEFLVVLCIVVPVQLSRLQLWLHW